MHWMTAVVLVVLALFTLLGWRAGLIRRVLELFGLVLSLVAAGWGMPYAGDLLAEKTGLAPGPADVVGWILVFVVCLLLTRLLAQLVSKTIQATILGWIDRVGGAALGLAGGLLVGSVLLMAAVHLPGGEARAEVIAEEPLLDFVHQAAPTLLGVVNADGDLERIWESAKQRAEDLDGVVDGVSEAVGERLGGDGN